MINYYNLRAKKCERHTLKKAYLAKEMHEGHLVVSGTCISEFQETVQLEANCRSWTFNDNFREETKYENISNKKNSSNPIGYFLSNLHTFCIARLMVLGSERVRSSSGSHCFNYSSRTLSLLVLTSCSPLVQHISEEKNSLHNLFQLVGISNLNDRKTAKLSHRTIDA